MIPALLRSHSSCKDQKEWMGEAGIREVHRRLNNMDCVQKEH